MTTKLFCGTCGAMMVGESGTSSSKGRKYHYYRCVNTKKHRACDAKHKTVRKLPLENAVVNAVMAKIMDDNFAEYVADAVMDIQSRESSVLPALRKQLEEAESGITNMLNAIQMGIINASTKQRLDELEERKKDIELQIIQEEMKHPAVSREDVIYFVCRFRSLDTSKLDARRRLIDSFVNAVIIFDDYERSSWKYMSYERGFRKEDLDTFKIGSTSSQNGDTIEPYLIGGDTFKGGGSAYGGKWKPSKLGDEKFIGKPGEIKQSFTKKGDLYETHIGLDGKADSETHYSDHGTPTLHDNPHTHDIYWDELGPHLGKIEHTGKAYGRERRWLSMKTIVPANTFEDDRFKTISDFKWCMKRGGEVQFEWNGVMYCCFGCVSPVAGAAPKMVICQAGSVEVNTRTEKWCDTADEILEYMVGDDRLRDVITQVKVWERTI